MSNDYYNVTGVPGTRASLSSANMRGELVLVQAGFNLLPSLSGNADAAVVVNAGATALTVVATTGTGSIVRSVSPTFTGTITAAAANFSGAVDIAGNFSVATNKLTVAAASGNTLVAGTLSATGNFAVNTNKFTVAASSGNTLVAGTFDVTGNVAFNTNKFTVAASSGNTLVAGTLDVTGNVAFNTNKFTVAAASGNTLVAGTLSATGNFAVNTTMFTVAASNGNTVVAGTLTVGGAVVVPTGLVLIQSQTASASTSLDFTTGITSTYDQYLFVFTDVIPVTDSVALWSRFSQNGGSSFLAGATSYAYANGQLITVDNFISTISSRGDSKIILASTQTNAAGGGISGEMRMFGPSSTTMRKKTTHLMNGFQTVSTTASDYYGGFGLGMYQLDTAAINAVRFMFSSGNIASGSIAMYGVRKT